MLGTRAASFAYCENMFYQLRVVKFFRIYIFISYATLRGCLSVGALYLHTVISGNVLTNPETSLHSSTRCRSLHQYPQL